MSGGISITREKRMRAICHLTYAGERVAEATDIEVDIVRKLAGQAGFVLLPRR